MRRLLIVLSIFCAPILFTGCSSDGGVRELIPVDHPDRALSNEVMRRLETDPVTRGLQLGVQANDGVVTLTGRLDSPVVQARAVSIARGTSGVRAVVDNTVRFR